MPDLRPRPRDLDRRILPHGWADLVRQALLFAGAYLLYELIRGLAGGADAARATANATRVIELERSLHVFVEPSLQVWAGHLPGVMDVAVAIYLNAHTVVTVGALTYIYLRRNESFYCVRNMFLVAMGIALVGYAVFPTAPPRLMPGWGFTDPIAHLTGIDPQRGATGVLVNPYAAIPSMHVCFALMVGWPMARFSSRRILRLAWRLYPALIALVVVITGNHYLIDIVLGAATAAVSGLVAQQLLARARPDAWAFERSAARSGPGLPDVAPVP